MDTGILKRLVSRIQEGHWWVEVGGFTKHNVKPRQKEIRTAKKLTVYSTGEHLMYMADTYAQIQHEDCVFTPYDTAFYIAFAEPDLVAKLVDHLLVSDDQNVTAEVKFAIRTAAMDALKDRLEFLERDYVEPEVVDVAC